MTHMLMHLRSEVQEFLKYITKGCTVQPGSYPNDALELLIHNFLIQAG